MTNRIRSRYYDSRGIFLPRPCLMSSILLVPRAVARRRPHLSAPDGNQPGRPRQRRLQFAPTSAFDSLHSHRALNSSLPEKSHWPRLPTSLLDGSEASFEGASSSAGNGHAVLSNRAAHQRRRMPDRSVCLPLRAYQLSLFRSPLVLRQDGRQRVVGLQHQFEVRRPQRQALAAHRRKAVLGSSP